MAREFEHGDIVWAKMKGFPPWPARIMQSCDKMDGIPAGRYSVLFFGTRETAIMKGSDLSEYSEHREEYEVPRRTKGFNEALKEARLAFGCTEDETVLPAAPDKSSPVNDDKSLIGMLGVNGSSGSKAANEKRCRRRSNRSDSGELKLEDLSASPTTSAQSAAKRMPSLSPAKDVCETKNERRRLESLSSLSGRRKTNSFSQNFGLDFNDDPMMPILNDGVFSNLLEGSVFDIDELSKSPIKSSLRSTKSVIENYLSSGKRRERFNSTSSSGRKRMTSGMSDVFDESLGLGISSVDPFSSLSLCDAPVFDDHPTTGLCELNAEFRERNPPQTYCSNCGCQCALYGIKWRCTSAACLKWNGIYDPYISGANTVQLPDTAKEIPEDVKTDIATLNVSPSAELRDSSIGSIHSPIASNIIPDCLAPDSFSSLFDQTSSLIVKTEEESGHIRESLQCTVQPNNIPTPTQSAFSSQSLNKSLSNSQSKPLRRIGNGRPKFYKVEKTPQVAEDGCRHCFYCNGQVRPQMCGGNRHRWRCVDKKCRKWYGWVRSHEEIPKDLGKKGRWKDLIRIRRKSPSFSEADGEQGEFGRKNTRKNARQSGSRPRYSGVLNLRSCMERRVRWWTNEKRQREASPEREFSSDLLDAAAVCVTLSKSMFSAANTRADEPGTVSGALDLLMDTLFSSLAPLLSLTKQVPNVLDQQTEKKLWEACATHTPKFA